MSDYSDVSAEIEKALEALIAKCEVSDKLAMLSYLLYHAQVEARDRKLDQTVLN